MDGWIDFIFYMIFTKGGGRSDGDWLCGPSPHHAPSSHLLPTPRTVGEEGKGGGGGVRGEGLQ